MNVQKIIATAGLVLLSAVGLYGCGGNRELTELSTDDTRQDLIPIPLPESEISSDMTADDIQADSPQLTALVDSLDEAREIADLYEIELDSYSYGVALYRTDKDITELINMGLENDYPMLTPNTEVQLHTEQ